MPTDPVALVRVAAPDDAPAIAALAGDVQALHHEAYPDLFKPGGPAAFGPDRFVALMEAPTQRVWAAEREGAIVGYAHAEAREEPDSPFRYRWRTLELHAIGVRADLRGRGVGALLLDVVRREAERWGARDLTLNVWAFNEDALAFYERHGFADYARRMWWPVPGGRIDRPAGGR